MSKNEKKYFARRVKCLHKGDKFVKIMQVNTYFGASPSGKATDSDSVIRVFESLRPSQNGHFLAKNG